MLHPDPEMRPSVQDIINHPWLTDGVATDEEYYQDMAERKAAKDAEFNSAIPSMDNCSGARDAVRRDGPSDQPECHDELTEEQKADPKKYRMLAVNTISPELIGMTSGKYIQAEMSAPDLFKWLQAVIDSGSGVERPEVDDKVFKMTYEF